MSIRLMESMCLSKNGGFDGGDDRWAVVEDYAVVADGETHKDPHLDPRVPAASATMVVEAVSHLPKGIDARRAFDEITQALRENRQAKSGYNPGCSVVVLSGARREVWRVGDCPFRIGEREFRAEKRLDQVAADVRAALTTALLSAGLSVDDLRKTDPGRELILPLLMRATAFRNQWPPTEWSFATCDGSPIPSESIEVYPIPDSVQEVVLASDGYPRLLSTLDDSEFFLRELLEKDPLCVGPLRGTKGVAVGAESFDDRTYLRLLVEG